MAEQRKLPLDEDKTRLKLSIDADEGARTAADDTDEKVEPSDRLEEEALNVGAHLRKERERQNLSLHDVAERLRLRAKQLQALEEGDYDSLPGQTFVVGFIRSYATTLGLDAVAVVDLYKSETGAGNRAPDLAFPEPTPEGRMPGASLMIASAAVALLLFAGWYYYLQENTLELEIVQELPERLMARISPDAVSTEDLGQEDLVDEGDDPVQSSSETLYVEQENSQKEPSSPSTVFSPNDVVAESSEDGEPEQQAANESEGAGVAIEGLPQTAAANSVSEETGEGDDQANSLDTEEQSDTETILADTTTADSEQGDRNITTQPASTLNEPNNQADRLAEDALSQVAETLPSNSDEHSESLGSNTGGFQQLTLLEAEAKREQETLPSVNEPVIMGVENAEARLVLVANQESWVQIKTVENETILDRVMAPGDTFMLPNRTDLHLSTANASGLELRLDGALLGSLGSYGQIVRELSLDPQQLRSNFSQ
ncbi:helix-turn-helix domain-containing protein [Sneathiella glossodoripedis]|uniref:helix-turn-helix domain-containing protein n=1 Tax=Sneathiella glossodoripedis TaxID=418853 RepID=UPI00047038BC|nr:helix-turn-helix domain-containing protein [Sneathiella glossodoripedis]